MSGAAPVALWVEALVAVLLLTSAFFVLTAAWGVVRLKDFFQRMHPPALAYTWAAWCVTFACIIYFSAQSQSLVLHTWIIIILLSITAPITTVLLARAALFRFRQAGRADMPPRLQPAQPEAPAGGASRGGPEGEE
ncbi:Na+/H+ antiporter subunit G [Comamonadaceae bacterium OH2545_COT-014]|nr:Na+/H+ antiporter subunit G [Comamonadaceae bacterium OH2545_COT-014]